MLNPHTVGAPSWPAVEVGCVFVQAGEWPHEFSQWLLLAFPILQMGIWRLGRFSNQSQACGIQAIGVPGRSTSGYWWVWDRMVGGIDFIPSPSLLPAGERALQEQALP